MLEAIGQVLPQAIAVAVSPMPLVALVVLMIGGDRKAAFVWAFGWMVAVFVGLGIGTLLAGTGPGAATTGTDGRTGPDWLALVIGILFWALSLRSFRHMPKKGEIPAEPRWMKGVSAMKPIAALGLVFVILLINPKNTAVYLSVGPVVAANTTGVTEAVATILIITLIASCTPIIVALIPAFMGSKADSVLNDMHDWLIRHNSLILAVLFLILGASRLGHFLTSLA